MKQLLIYLTAATALGALLIYAAYQQRGYPAAGGEWLLFAGLVTAVVVMWKGGRGESNTKKSPAGCRADTAGNGR